MTKDLFVSKLGDLGKVSMCKRVLKHQTSENEDIPFYKISTFGGVASTYISNEMYESFRAKYSYPNIGDILISAAGTIGKTVIFNGEPSYFQDSNIVWIANDENKVTNQYLYYYYLTEPWIATSGSTIKRLYNDNIRSLIINYPEICTQKQITKVLSDLDAKIELNNKINSELEAMAKLIYDYWFVQFDFPNENGKPYKTTGGKMVYNKELKREVPEGWEIKELKELAYLKAGGDKPKELSKTPTDRFKVPIYSNGVTDGGLYGYAEQPKVEEPSFTISARGTIGYSVLRMTPFVPIIRLIAVTPKNKIHLKFLHERVKMLKFDDSGSVQKQLTVPMISSLKLILPKEDLLEKYSGLTIAWINKIENNKKENQQLSELRDWLLPILMNGQVRVGEVNQN